MKKIKSPDLSALHDVCSKISRSNKDALVSIESTVPVGTCRNVAKMYGLMYVVHVPHRYWAKDPVRYGVRQLRVFGALNEESKRIGLDFYKKLDIPLHVCSSIEIAEMCKIVENC
jgi:UDP-N-acetyl-D-mannosaminuronate dehydrogenase